MHFFTDVRLKSQGFIYETSSKHTKKENKSKKIINMVHFLFEVQKYKLKDTNVVFLE